MLNKLLKDDVFFVFFLLALYIVVLSLNPVVASLETPLSFVKFNGILK